MFGPQNTFWWPRGIRELPLSATNFDQKITINNSAVFKG